jgi:hypothetical protein
MEVKCKIEITLNQGGNKYFVRLLELDPLKNDLMEGQWIENNSYGFTSKPEVKLVEFLFPFLEVGEFYPELQIIIFSEAGEKVYQSEINKDFSFFKLKDVDHFIIDFKPVIL